VATTSSDGQVGANQVEAWAERNQRPKGVVAALLYCTMVFLRAFLMSRFTLCLGADAQQPGATRGATRTAAPPERMTGREKHGLKFKLSSPWREPDQIEETTLLNQKLVLKAWNNLHFARLPLLVGMVVSVRFLKSDGTPRFKRPLLFFWTSPTIIALVELVRMDLWRFAIELMFRSLKPKMGLTTANSPDLGHRQRWIWCCALAVGQRLLMRQQVADRRPPWHPTKDGHNAHSLTPGQVQRQALAFLVRLGTSARPPQLAGKGPGRPCGFTHSSHASAILWSQNRNNGQNPADFAGYTSQFSC